MDSQKINIKVRDNTFNHEPNFLKDTENIHFIRNCIKDSDGDVQIKNGDIVLYTDNWFTKIHPDSKINIGLLIESPEVTPDSYHFISTNNKKFDLVLTHNKELLDKGENFILNLYGTSWMADSFIQLWKKEKLCSIITSTKNFTSGHNLRHYITNNITENNLKVDLYGEGFIPLKCSETKAFDKNHTARHESNEKIKGLKDYMFSIIIENTKKDYYFTEKLIDSFLTGTVPIYYGCPSIGNIFNTKGMIIIDNVDDCLSALKKINKNKYEHMLPYIKDNFERAKKYKDFNINEKSILKKLNIANNFS